MRRRYQVLLAVAVSTALALPALGAGAACDIPAAERVAVAGVGAGGRLLLADGRHVRLALVETPLGSPFAELFAARLKSLAHETISLALSGKGTDRHGDVLAQIFMGQGAWLQQQLVSEGLARVRTRLDMRACAAALLAAEDEARSAKRGLWADPRYRVRKPEELEHEIGVFHIVEGKALSVSTRRKHVYVNFGPDYRTDFTLTLKPADAKRFAKAGIDPSAWAGKTVRVRGWISRLNGPEIELTHPEQIQALD